MLTSSCLKRILSFLVAFGILFDIRLKKGVNKQFEVRNLSREYNSRKEKKQQQLNKIFG